MLHNNSSQGCSCAWAYSLWDGWLEIILSVCFYTLTWTVAKVGKQRVFWEELNVPNISISNMKSAQHKENVKQVSVMWEGWGYVYIWVCCYLWSVSIQEYSSLWCCTDSTGYFQSNVSNVWNAGQHYETLSLEAHVVLHKDNLFWCCSHLVDVVLYLIWILHC